MIFATTALDVLAVTGVIAALTTAGIGVIVTKSSEWWQWRRGSATHTIELEFPSGPELGMWKVLYVRDGADEVTTGLSEREKWFARLKNEIRSFDEARDRPTAKRATVRFYRPLGFQFKCFIEVESRSAADSVQRLLEAQGCRDIDISPERKDEGETLLRIWFLHPDSGDAGSGSRYRVVTAPDNAKNNFFYPV
jgi:hypothetical protein